MSIIRESETRIRELQTDLLLAAALFAWTFFVNRGFRISGLYMDDLYMWSCWGEQSFLEYVFPLNSTRCRFLYWMAAWAELALVKNHLGWIVPINLLLNAALGVFLYGFAQKLSKSRIVGFWAALLFLSSPFAYYQVGQLLGLMETMGLCFALAQCWFLYRYRKERQGHSFYLALLFYFLNCFTHERYMVLLPMFFCCLLLKRERRWQRWLSPLVTFLAVMGLRVLMIGTLSPAGTGGTQVADTFTKRGALMNLLSELLYCMGVNAGPEHLNGLPWELTPFPVKLLVLFANLLMLLFLTMAVFDLRHMKRYGISAGALLGDLVFFLGFALGCAAAAAVTIRVELRWVYAVYTFLLLLIAMLFGARRRVRLKRDADPEAQQRYSISDHLPLLVLCAFLLFMLPVQLCYRSHAGKIYLFPNQARYNSLADVSYGKYGDAIFGKEIIIIGNSYEMSEFTAETFFKTFDPARRAAGTTVRHVDSALDFGQVTDSMLVYMEDPAHDGFLDATELVRSMKLSAEYGYYRDGWMDERARLTLLTGGSGEIVLQLMYPGNLRGDEHIFVQQDGGEIQEYPLEANVSELRLAAPPRQLVTLSFSQNFYVENAAEQRGEDRLSMIVSFVTD